MDDNIAILDIVSTALRWDSLRVSSTDFMADFTNSVFLMQPDLVLLHKSLGSADGCDLCTNLTTSEAIHHVPVIMCSAVGQTWATALVPAPMRF